MNSIPSVPNGAIENGRVFLQRLAEHYDFSCEAGSLANCTDYQEAVRCFEFIAEWFSGFPYALPHLPAPCAVEVQDGGEEKRIDALRIQAFKTNSDADRHAYFDAVSKYFQDRHFRRMEAKPVDVAAVRKQAFEEGFENGVEQSLNALNSYDDITRKEAEMAITKLKPDYRALSASHTPEAGK